MTRRPIWEPASNAQHYGDGLFATDRHWMLAALVLLLLLLLLFFCLFLFSFWERRADEIKAVTRENACLLLLVPVVK